MGRYSATNERRRGTLERVKLNAPRVGGGMGSELEMGWNPTMSRDW